jgi:hypothetical protein
MLFNSLRRNIDNMKALDFEQYLAVKSTPKKIIPKNIYENVPKYSCDSNETINLKLIKEEDEMFTETDYFHPVYTNQVVTSLEFRRSSMSKRPSMDI